MFRKILSWEWYQDANTARLFFHLLLTVNLQEDRWMGVKVPRGARVVSVAKLGAELKLTNKKIRTALEHLKRSGEVAITRHSKFSIISIVRWSDYQVEGQNRGQSKDNHLGNQGAIKGQQNKNIEKNKEEKNIVPDGVSASQPFYDLSPSKMQPLDESPEERSDRLKKLRES